MAFSGRAELPSAAQDRCHEVRRRCPWPIQELCCHHVDHPSCPHSHGCSGGRRRPRPCTAFAVTTRHFSRFLFVRRRRLRRVADSVCDKLARQGTVQMQPSALPVYYYYFKRLSLRLPSSRFLCLPLCRLCPKCRSPLRLP